MMRVIQGFMATFLVLCSLGAAAENSARAQQILREYESLREMVLKTQPDGEVGGYFKEKVMGPYSLLWRVGSDEETIRIFRSGQGRSDFAVTYHKNRAILPGHLVLRRFIGPEPTGWMNETVDVETGNYLGQQGVADPFVSPEDLAFLRTLGIQP